MDKSTYQELLAFFTKNIQSSCLNLEELNDTQQKKFLPENYIANIQSQEGKAFAQEYFQYVGIIRSIWFDKKSTLSRPQKCLYGTAFLIRPTIIITCTHNVYDTMQKRRADKVIFIPGQNDYNISKGIVYQCNQFKFLPLEQHVSLDLYPTINDLCVGRLQKHVKLQYEIPMEECYPLPHQNLTMIAYPNKGYRQNAHNLLSICLDRRHTNGRLVAIKSRNTFMKRILYHMKLRHSLVAAEVLFSQEGKVNYTSLECTVIVVGIITNTMKAFFLT